MQGWIDEEGKAHEFPRPVNPYAATPMPPWGSRRGVPRTRRERILSRDRGECQLRLDRLHAHRDEIDHIGDPYDDSDELSASRMRELSPCPLECPA